MKNARKNWQVSKSIMQKCSFTQSRNFHIWIRGIPMWRLRRCDIEKRVSWQQLSHNEGEREIFRFETRVLVLNGFIFSLSPRHQFNLLIHHRISTKLHNSFRFNVTNLLIPRPRCLLNISTTITTNERREKKLLPSSSQFSPIRDLFLLR